MNRYMVALGVILMVAVLPFVSFASETYTCSVVAMPYDGGVGDDGGAPNSADGGVAGRTDFPTYGTTCSWGANATIKVQCDQDVYYRVRGANVRATPASASSAISSIARANAPQATPVDVKLSWVATASTDPYTIFLGRDEQLVSVVAVAAQATCRFYSTTTTGPNTPQTR